MEQVHGARVFYNREITKVDPNTLLDKIKKEISDLGLSRSKRFRSNIPRMYLLSCILLFLFVSVQLNRNSESLFYFY